MNTQYKILIASDSRGRGLQRKLISSNIADKCWFKTVVSPGANIAKITEVISYESKHKFYDLIIIFAGICNFTERKQENDLKLLTYTKIKDDVEVFLQSIDVLYKDYPNRLMFANIPPAGLIKYFKTYNPDSVPAPDYLKVQENKLVKDLLEVNKCIISKNYENGLKFIDLDKKILSSSLPAKRKRSRLTSEIRRYSLIDKHLTDGVHADDHLKDLWFGRFVAIIDNWAESRAISSESQQSDEDKSWDFKRS